MITGIAGPLVQVTGALSPIQALDTPWISGTGAVLAVAGIVATLYGQRDMGASWRIGVDSSESTTLVRRGAFAYVRNPIFAAMLIFAAGITLMAPNPLALIAFWVLLATIELQVRVVEEPYLLRTHGDTYLGYLRTVGRFVPGIGRVG
ncbi:methyltransferase [Mycolicibacter sinensis]|nr:methyltransferase [Mycolicibacter sinensis]